MGESRDTAAQVEAVRKRFPESSYLAMVGISAGSGLLVTYLGKVNLIALPLYCRALRVVFFQEGDRTPVQAAASLCPAYDITRAFRFSFKLILNFNSFAASITAINDHGLLVCKVVCSLLSFLMNSLQQGLHPVIEFYPLKDERDIG